MYWTYLGVTESQDSRAGENLSDYLVLPLILNVGKLRSREVRDLSEVVCLEHVNATLSAPLAKTHFLMMMKKMILRIAGGIAEAHVSSGGCRKAHSVLLCLSQVYLGIKINSAHGCQLCQESHLSYSTIFLFHRWMPKSSKRLNTTPQAGRVKGLGWGGMEKWEQVMGEDAFKPFSGLLCVWCSVKIGNIARQSSVIPWFGIWQLLLI